MELFSGLADMHGEGLPLSYLFVVTNTDAPPHTKETVLVNWMAALKARGITPEFTLSDKSEINALGRVWPTAKHQLCLWHILRALKRRLANNREPPAYYGSADATRMFAFIDPAFLPLGQMSTNDKVCIYSYSTWPAILIYHRPPTNRHLKSQYDQYGSSYKAVPRSIPGLSKRSLLSHDMLKVGIGPCCHPKICPEWKRGLPFKWRVRW